jgi:hypothetical protein
MEEVFVFKTDDSPRARRLSSDFCDAEIAARARLKENFFKLLDLIP